MVERRKEDGATRGAETSSPKTHSESQEAALIESTRQAGIKQFITDFANRIETYVFDVGARTYSLRRVFSIFRELVVNGPFMTSRPCWNNSRDDSGDFELDLFSPMSPMNNEQTPPDGVGSGAGSYTYDQSR